MAQVIVSRIKYRRYRRICKYHFLGTGDGKHFLAASCLLGFFTGRPT